MRQELDPEYNLVVDGKTVAKNKSQKEIDELIPNYPTAGLIESPPANQEALDLIEDSDPIDIPIPFFEEDH